MLDRFVQSGFTLGVATSKLETYAVQILEHFSLAPYFKVAVGSLPDNSRGEKKEVIAEALHQLGARPGQTVMVGDRKYDILGAKANGVASIGVRYGYAAPWGARSGRGGFCGPIGGRTEPFAGEAPLGQKGEEDSASLEEASSPKA